MGRYLYAATARLSRHEIVGEIAGGKGLLLGIELVKERKTKNHLRRNWASRRGLSRRPWPRA